MPGFMLAPFTVAMIFPMLNLLLMIFLALEPLWVSHISIQTIVMLDLGETLIIHSLEVRTMSLKMCVKIEESGLDLFYFYFLFSFQFIFYIFYF